jgi:hypothetical protein
MREFLGLVVGCWLLVVGCWLLGSVDLDPSRVIIMGKCMRKMQRKLDVERRLSALHALLQESNLGLLESGGEGPVDRSTFTSNNAYAAATQHLSLHKKPQGKNLHSTVATKVAAT